MRHTALELLTMTAAAAIMASMVLAGGTAIKPVPQPIAPWSRTATWTTGDENRCLEVPVTGAPASGVAGQASLCNAGRDLCVTLRVNSLAPFARYTAWLGSFDKPASCVEASCESIDVSGLSPVVPLDTRKVGEGVASPSRTLEIDGLLKAVHLVSGGQVTLMLLRPGGRAGPHAQAVFTLP